MKGMIKGCSPAADNNRVALVTHLHLMALRTRCWVEYVDSGSNPADVYSRAGWDDDELKCQLESGALIQVSAVCPPWRELAEAPLEQLWELISALGV